MKLFYITNSRIPTEKAHGYQISKMCAEFANLGLDVELIIPNRKNKIKESLFSFYGVKENFKVSFIKSINFLDFSSGNIFFYLSKMFFLLRLVFIKIDSEAIIYTRDPEIAWLFKLKKHQVIYSAHNWPQSKEGLFKFFLKDIDYIVCNSKGTNSEFTKHNFINTLIAPNAVDLDEFDINNYEKDLLKELNLSDDKKIIMYVGHLYDWKGINVIIEVAELLKEKKDIVFVLIGGTKKDIEKYRRIKKEKDLDNILILSHVKHNLIPKYLKLANILLLPNTSVTEESKKYTSPIKVFEYMASKKPILAICRKEF